LTELDEPMAQFTQIHLTRRRRGPNPSSISWRWRPQATLVVPPSAGRRARRGEGRATLSSGRARVESRRPSSRSGSDRATGSESSRGPARNGVLPSSALWAPARSWFPSTDVLRVSSWTPALATARESRHRSHPPQRGRARPTTRPSSSTPPQWRPRREGSWSSYANLVFQVW